MDLLGSALLAGGQARRMGGSNKALLTFQGRTFGSLILEKLEREFSTVYISSNDENPFPNHRVIGDIQRGCGPLGGLEAVLEQAEEEHIFFVSCDMPLIQSSFIQLIKREFDPSLDGLVPRDRRGRYLPTCGVYSRKILPIIRDSLARGEYKVQALYSQIKIKVLSPALWEQVDPRGLSLLNINTPGEYKELQNSETQTSQDSSR